MDIKAKVEEIVKKIQADENFAAEFQANPAKAIEKVSGVEIPEEAVNAVIDGVKAKLTADNVKGALGGIGNLLGGLKK